MNDIVNLISNTIRPSLESLERGGVGHIDLECQTDKGGYHFRYTIDGKEYGITVEYITNGKEATNV